LLHRERGKAGLGTRDAHDEVVDASR
jgi:hypothetical protein